MLEKTFTDETPKAEAINRADSCTLGRRWAAYSLSLWRERERERDRPTDRQEGRQAVRQAGRRTDGQTGGEGAQALLVSTGSLSNTSLGEVASWI